MTEPYPDFDGSDPYRYPIQEFSRKVRKALVINDVNLQRWSIILDALIQGEAKIEYDAAIAAGTIDSPDGGADAAAQAANARLRFTNRINWLETRYHTQEVQDDMKRTVGLLAQMPNENPKKFHTRVMQYIRDAGFPAAAQDTMVKQAWLNGLHRTIINHIRSLNTMPFADMVTTAQNYWKVLNPGVNRIPPQEEDREPEVHVPLPSREITPIQERSSRPAKKYSSFRERYQEAPIEDQLDDLTRAFGQLQAHLADQKINRRDGDRVYRYDDPPRQEG